MGLKWVVRGLICFLALHPHPHDVLYEFRLVAFAGSYVSDPSNTANVSTSGENLPGEEGAGGLQELGAH